jgi:class 3 adenylate cyclase
MKTIRTDQTKQVDRTDDIEKEVVILLSDMVGYSRKASIMHPAEIRNFMLEYYQNLKKIVQSVCGTDQHIESSAGDGAVAIFEKKPGKTKNDICDRALNVALAMVNAMEKGVIPQTRIGLFSGNIIETDFDGKIMRFGAGFSVASRLEELCEYFGTSVLMDREVAKLQTSHTSYVTSIGKITPKNLAHPVHIFSVYRPGMHHCPEDVDEEELRCFIEKKNLAVELFCGNDLQGILPDFPLAKQKLLEVQSLFGKIAGKKDKPTERLLEYIDNNSRPKETFRRVGMKIWGAGKDSNGIRLLSLSSELFKALDQDFYQALVVDTSWERKFKLLWYKKDDQIIRLQDDPDGIYFIDAGSVSVLDKNNQIIATLTTGNVFGEMAYLSEDGVRTANVFANSDLVLRRISGEDLDKLPVIKDIFNTIARKRKMI